MQERFLKFRKGGSVEKFVRIIHLWSNNNSESTAELSSRPFVFDYAVLYYWTFGGHVSKFSFTGQPEILTEA